MKAINAVLLKIVGLIIKQISPEIKSLLYDFLLTLKEKAKATDNPWDDIAIQLLISILGVED